MKKIFVALTALAVLLTSSLAMAAFEENIEEGVDLTTVKKLAVAYPNYYKVAEKEPSFQEFTRDLYNVGKISSNLDIISYDEIVSVVRREIGVDLLSLAPEEAEKIYNQQIAKYADAYLIVTVANNSGKPWIFYYVYNAADSALMYTYSVQSKSIGKNTKDYQKATEGFYQKFDEAAAKKLSKEERKKLEEKKRYENKSRKMKKVIYKTGKSKEDLVKKK